MYECKRTVKSGILFLWPSQWVTLFLKSEKQTNYNNQCLFHFGIMVKRYHNKFKEGHTYSACSAIHKTTQLINIRFLPFTLLCNMSSWNHPLPLCCCSSYSHSTHKLLSPFKSSPLSFLNILSIIQWSVKHTHAHASFYKMDSHANIQTQACTQWAPVYLRLLLLGCDPARPGWSGLWRFCRGTHTVYKVHSSLCS